MNTFTERLTTYARDEKKAFASVWSAAKGVESRLTFNEFAAAVATGAASFRDKFNIIEEVRVALLTKGTLNFFIALVSLQWLGATPVLLNWRQTIDNLIAMVHDAGAAAVATATPYTELAFEIGLPVIDLDGSVWSWRSTGSWEPIYKLPTSDEAVVFFTSGSTGSKPKPVLHTHRSLLWTADNFPLDKQVTSTLCFMPNFHVLQTFQNFLLCLARKVGCSIHGDDATAPITSRLLLDACDDLKPSTIDTVPFIMNEWSTLSRDELQPLVSCLAVRSGGAPLSVTVATRLFKAGIHVQTHYGQTEAPGMQLLTLPGVKPNELAILMPPWPSVEVKLDETSAELLIKGCGGSSPGYLKAGKLVPGSSRIDSTNWHHTGDIFDWVETASGDRGLKHVMRVDDTVLLSTGEMFNPVPIETAVEAYAIEKNVQIARLVVLGKNHAAPFLVIELVKRSSMSASEVLILLEKPIADVNATQAEYARIRAGHILILDANAKLSLPHSAKGNIIRAKAEAILAEHLSRLAEDALALDAQSWDILTDKAHDAGYEDLEAFLAGQSSNELKVMGIDSLGISSFTTQSARMAERIGDNVKALIITCVVMCHWYDPSVLDNNEVGAVGGLGVFYLAKDSGKFTAVSLLVQYLVTISSFITGLFSMSGVTPCLTALIFSMGYTDGARDGRDRCIKAFGQREKTMVVLILFYKVFVYLISLLGFKYSIKSSCLAQKAPLQDCWFLYAILFYRGALFCVQRLFRRSYQPFILIIGSFIILVLSNEVSCAFCKWSFPNEKGAPEFGAFLLSLIVDSRGLFVLDSTLDIGLDRKPYYRIGSTDLVFVFAGERDDGSIAINVLDKAFLFLPFYVIGYYYGEKITLKFCRLYLKPLGVFTLAVSSLTVNILLTTSLANWVVYKQPWALWRTKVTDDSTQFWLSSPPPWLWQKSSSEEPSIRAWNPRWKRPWYIAVDYFVSSCIGLLLVATCVALPFRASRCGNAALGKYFFAQLYPGAMYSWLLISVSKLGTTFGAQNPIVQLAQLIMLLCWPFVFVYFFGPFLTAFIISVPKFIFWVGRILSSPTTALLEAANFISDFPNNLSSWFSVYMAEIMRDASALRGALFRKHRGGALLDASGTHLPKANYGTTTPIVAANF